MKVNKFILLYVNMIVMSSLVIISGNNSPIRTKHLEYYDKRKLQEDDNYIIIQYGKTVNYSGGFIKETYKSSISYIKNGDEVINNIDQAFTVVADIKLEVHFKESLTDIESLLDTDYGKNFEKLISVDFSHFDTSLVTFMRYMLYGCSSLQQLDLSNFDTSNVVNMAYMFYGCSSLQNLNLSNFNTARVESFDGMFKNCTSLKYLSLSNFNFDNASEYLEEMFLGLEKLEYIDLYVKDSYDNLKFEIIYENGLNNKDGLIVCQNKDFIDNPKAIYQCCKIIKNILNCNNIEKTITTIETTIPQILTTNPIIETTNPLLETTFPTFQSSQIQTSTFQSTNTTNTIESTISQIETSIPKLETTFPNGNITNIETTIPKIINRGATLILMGFHSFKIVSSIMSFYVYFTPIINYVYSTLMKFGLIINYNTRIRLLEEEEIECQLKEINNKGITSYYCEKEIKNSNIKQVKVIPNFNFTYQDNVTVIGSTPFARMFMNNLQDIDDTYDNLQNYTVYILDHSIYDKYSNNLYNVTGIMNQTPKSNLENKNINLMINLESESKIKTESSCTIIKSTENNYTLNCKYNENIKGDLQSAISFISDDEILLVNFDGGNNNTIVTKNPTAIKYVSKKSNGLKAGAIVAIVLALVFALAAVIGIALCMKNGNIFNRNKTEGSESIAQILK